VDALDERVAVLEENLGGWRFWGELRFDARWADESDGAYDRGYYTHRGETEFDLNRFRLFMSRQIDDKTTFTARIGRSGSTSDIDWERYYATIQLPWDSFLMVGLWPYDWEGEAGLYIDEDAWFTDQNLTGFYWRKNLAKGDITLFATHDEADGVDFEEQPFVAGQDRYNYGARFNFNMNDKFRIALSGLYFDFDNDGTVSDVDASVLWNEDISFYDYGVYWVDFGITFTPGFQFKGAYYMQDHDGPNIAGVPFDDSPNAYKAIIDVSQDTLKFTSLWLEYAKLDPNFHTPLQPWSAYGAEVTPALMESPVINVFETEVIFVYLQQQWSDKWVTYQRYGQFDHSPEGYAREAGLTGGFDITNWTFGVQYWYTPTVMFELAYDDVDYDDGWTKNVDADLKDDNLIRFRTHIFF
nr:S-layer protein [Bacillota bacterium]